MENLNPVEILKLGLPGLVFLLSMMSYRLLSQEKNKADPRNGILSAIQKFMYINLLLAILTVVAPIVDHSILPKNVEKSLSKIPAKTGGMPLEKSKAAICEDSEYRSRYILIMDMQTDKMIRKQSRSKLIQNQ